MDAKTIISKYGLVPHPEGGWYRELYRAAESVRCLGDGRVRSASTAIHFLLDAGGVSRWHRVVSDELWHFCEGDPLDLREIGPDLSRLDSHRLGGDGGEWFRVVPAGAWQAARSLGACSLVTCVVSPGFDFSDFRLLADEPGARDEIIRRFPGAEAFC
jgi:uncharacterized protein